LVAQREAEVRSLGEARAKSGWTAFQWSDRVAIGRFQRVRAKWIRYEDLALQKSALKRFYDFAYQWY
jgi:hypothetical protein